MTDLPQPEPAPPVALDLVRRDVVVPKLRRIALICFAVGAALALLVSLVSQLWIGVLVGAVVGGPPGFGALFAARRAAWLDGRTVYSRGLTTKSVDTGALRRAEITVQPGRFRQVHLVLQDHQSTVTVHLALYGTDRGAELDLMAIRRLADVLAMSESITAGTVSRVLVEHLRAEARGAALTERPLYRAVERAESQREPGAPRPAAAQGGLQKPSRTGRVVLTDADLVSLLDTD